MSWYIVSAVSHCLVYVAAAPAKHGEQKPSRMTACTHLIRNVALLLVAGAKFQDCVVSIRSFPERVLKEMKFGFLENR